MASSGGASANTPETGALATVHDNPLPIESATKKQRRTAITEAERRGLRYQKFVEHNGEISQKALQLWFFENHNRWLRQSTISESLSNTFAYLDGPGDLARPQVKRRKPGNWPAPGSPQTARTPKSTGRSGTAGLRMSSASKRGALVVIEGLDRAGKSTQHESLCSKLEFAGRKVKRMRFPDRSTSIGQSIDSYLRGTTDKEDHVIHLLFSANRWEAAASIQQAIESGITVVIDRYYYSGIVYSAAKGNATLSMDWARQPDVGLPRPDIVIFLDISPENAQQRGGFGEEKYETREMQKRVRILFSELMAAGDEKEDVRIVDAGGWVEEVRATIWVLIEKLMRSDALDKPLRQIR